jgi:hypothetical protein
LEEESILERIYYKQMNDLSYHHAFWNHIQSTLNRKLASGLDGAETALVKEIYDDLKRHYDNTLKTREIVDNLLSFHKP